LFYFLIEQSRYDVPGFVVFPVKSGPASP